MPREESIHTTCKWREGLEKVDFKNKTYYLSPQIIDEDKTCKVQMEYIKDYP